MTQEVIPSVTMPPCRKRSITMIDEDRGGDQQRERGQDQAPPAPLRRRAAAATRTASSRASDSVNVMNTFTV